MNDWDDIPTQIQDLPKQADTRVWSEEQLAIKKWAMESKKNAMVVARAGCAKTSSIEAMIVPFAPEGRMVYLVFNKKNKLVAEEKIKDPRCDVKTFNGLGFSFVRQQWARVKPDDAVEGDRVREVAGKIPRQVVTPITQLIAWAKNTAPFADAADLWALAEDQGFEADPEDQKDWPTDRLAEIAEGAMKLAKEPDPEGRISFNDQLWLPVVMGWAKPSWELVIIDEFQDTNRTQHLMVEKIAKPGGRVVIVGDPRQQCYGFRGAAENSMETFRKKFNPEVLTLTTTYRCAKAIVQEAKSEVPDFKFHEKAAPGLVREQETWKAMKEVKPGDAVLSRYNAPLMPLCLSLLKQGIPAKIEGRDIGKQLHNIALGFKAASVSEFLKAVSVWRDRRIKRIRAKDMSEEMTTSQCEAVHDQADVFFAVAEDAKSVQDVLLKLTNLFQDNEGSKDSIVVLSSVHRAKGLEWQRVFALSASFKRARGGEEANLWYIAATRAKNELVWVL